MIILNVYHVDPVPPVPRWLKWITGTQNAVAPEYDNDGEMNSVPSLRRYIKTDSKFSTNSFDINSRQNDNNNILELLAKLAKTTKCGYGSESEESLRAEWQLAAKKMDRFFFVVFLITNLILTLSFITTMQSLDDA